MQAVVKIRGEHTIDYYSLTLLTNDGATVNCSAEANYSAYSDETVIVIKPGGSNNIGGAGNTWKIEGPMTIEGVAMAISIKAPEQPTYGGHAVSSTPALPAEIGDTNNGISVTTDTATIAASIGENVGSVTINGITYGLYIKAEALAIEFEIKENEGSTPLSITVRGLSNFGPRIEFSKTDQDTYIMSAINLVW